MIILLNKDEQENDVLVGTQPNAKVVLVQTNHDQQDLGLLVDIYIKGEK